MQDRPAKRAGYSVAAPFFEPTGRSRTEGGHGPPVQDYHFLRYAPLVDRAGTRSGRIPAAPLDPTAGPCWSLGRKQELHRLVVPHQFEASLEVSKRNHFTRDDLL